MTRTLHAHKHRLALTHLMVIVVTVVNTIHKDKHRLSSLEVRDVSMVQEQRDDNNAGVPL